MTAIRTALNARTADLAVKPVDYFDVGGGGLGLGPFAAGHVILDATGAPISRSNPLAVGQAGSRGVDWSANKPAVPGVGQPFSSGGTYPSYQLIATVPANDARLQIDIQNNWNAQIILVICDGTAAPNQSPAKYSVIALAGGVIGGQNGSYSSSTERGRIQVYSSDPAAQVSIREN